MNVRFVEVEGNPAPVLGARLALAAARPQKGDRADNSPPNHHQICSTRLSPVQDNMQDLSNGNDWIHQQILWEILNDQNPTYIPIRSTEW